MPAAFTKKEIQTIVHFCGPDLTSRLQGARRNLNSTMVKIVNTGMVSSGKSSLYNILTDSMAEERFPTGAARTTTSADSYVYNSIEFIDTPGIDVRDADDDLSFQTVMQSDIILMVHNIKTGPLTRSESDWLQTISNSMNSPEMRQRRLIFVCTWKDTREQEEGYADILNEVRQMVSGIVGTEIPFFDVSVKKYVSGIQKGKNILCQKSGIPELSAFINEQGAKYASVKQTYAYDNFQKVSNEVKTMLFSARRDLSGQVMQKRSSIERNYRSRRNTWSNIFNIFKSYREAFEKAKDELKCIKSQI